MRSSSSSGSTIQLAEASESEKAIESSEEEGGEEKEGVKGDSITPFMNFAYMYTLAAVTFSFIAYMLAHHI